MEFKYQIHDTYVSIQKYLGRSKFVIIPNTIENLPVTVICPFAFDDCNSIQVVVLPDTLQKIRTGAFRNCRTLVSIIPRAALISGAKLTQGEAIIPGLTKTIAASAFENCNKLKKIVFRGFPKVDSTSFPEYVQYHYSSDWNPAVISSAPLKSLSSVSAIEIYSFFSGKLAV